MPPEIAAYTAFAAAVAAVVIMILREIKPFILAKPEGNGHSMSKSCELCQREVSVAVTTSFSNLMAPLMNSFNATHDRLTECMTELQRDQSRILEILAVLADRRERERNKDWGS